METCGVCGAVVAGGGAHRPGCPAWSGEPAGPRTTALPRDPVPPGLPATGPVPPGPRSPGPVAPGPVVPSPGAGLGPEASGAAWLPGAPAPGAPDGGLVSSVDAFEDGLIPFLGDPNASRLLGRAVQATTALLALYNLVRAAFWAYFAYLLNRPFGVFTRAEVERVESFGRLVDTIDTLFWPTFIVAITVEILWNRKRRPRDVLQAQGEVYVEATIQRAVPIALRVGLMVCMFGGLAISFVMSPASVTPAEATSFATARVLSSLAFAAGWALLIPWVFASERHLRRRIAKANDPVLAAYTVPFVVPEAEPGALGSSGRSAGVGWLLRTAGLVLAGLFSSLIVIGSLFGLGTDPLLALAWLVGAGSVLALVVWAFVRRWRAAHPVAPVP